MSDENEDSKKVPAIFAALAAVHSELSPIAKDKKGYGYSFRGIDDVQTALNPLLKKHKIIIRKDNLVINRTSKVNSKGKEQSEAVMQCDYVFTSLEDGSEIRTSGGNEGIDSSGGDKAISMCYSNSYKYMLFEFFCIPTKDQKDSDQVTAKTRNPSVDSNKRGSAYRKSTGGEDVL